MSKIGIVTFVIKYSTKFCYIGFYVIKKFKACSVQVENLNT